MHVLSASTNLIYRRDHSDSELLHSEGRPRDSRFAFWSCSSTQRASVKETLGDVHTLLLAYMRAQLFLCAATLISFSVVLSAMQVPYSILLAAVAFPLEFIPLVGPLMRRGERSSR